MSLIKAIGIRQIVCTGFLISDNTLSHTKYCNLYRWYTIASQLSLPHRKDKACLVPSNNLRPSSQHRKKHLFFWICSFYNPQYIGCKRLFTTPTDFKFERSGNSLGGIWEGHTPHLRGLQLYKSDTGKYSPLGHYLFEVQSRPKVSRKIKMLGHQHNSM